MGKATRHSHTHTLFFGRPSQSLATAVEQGFNKLLLVEVEVFTSVFFSAATFLYPYHMGLRGRYSYSEGCDTFADSMSKRRRKKQHIAPKIETNPPGRLDHLNKFY